MAFEPLLNAAVIALDLPSVCPRDVAGETSRGAGSLPAAASTVVPAALPGPELPAAASGRCWQGNVLSCSPLSARLLLDHQHHSPDI